MQVNKNNVRRGRPHIWADRFSGGAQVDIAADDPVEGIIAIGSFTLLLFLIPVLFLVVFYIAEIFSLLDRTIENKPLLGAGVAGTALGVGVALFQLRKYKRRIYALLEISFAVITAWTAIGKLNVQGSLNVWLAFGGAAYLVVRGLDNLQIAREEEKASTVVAETQVLPALTGDASSKP